MARHELHLWRRSCAAVEGRNVRIAVGKHNLDARQQAFLRKIAIQEMPNSVRYCTKQRIVKSDVKGASGCLVNLTPAPDGHDGMSAASNCQRYDQE